MKSGVQRMTRPVPNTGGASENMLGSKIEIRYAGRGLLFYLAPTIIFFAVDAIGLWHLPGDFWGMYGNDDGIWAAWNLRGIFQWSWPFDLAPFNPLSGMGSTFLPNTPWLNPAAIALALPFPREVSYLISYFVYFVELSLSLVLLFRVVGLSPLEAIISAQLYLLILFPPTNGSFITLTWYSLAPVNAHLVAICNLLLVLILIAGRYGVLTNLICGVGIFFLLVCGIFSAPVTFMTYAPVYAVAGAALLLGAKPNTKELGWKLAAVLASGVVLWLLGFKDYLQGTSLISGRAATYPAAFAAGADLLTWHYWRDAWGKFDACAHPYFLCQHFPSFYIFIGSSMGAALCVFQRTTLRPLAVGMLLFFAFVYAFDFAGSISLFGSAHAIGTPFLIWSSFPFTVLFLGLLIFRIARFIGALLPAFSRPSRLNVSLKAGVATFAATALTLIIPALALADWQLRTRLFQPPPPTHNPQIGLLGQSSVRHAKTGTITRYLIDQASIVPGSPFRGYTATYLVDPQGPLWEQMQKAAASTRPLSKLELYIAARPFFDRHYQNRLQETDLWEHNIPTLEEYGQWVTKSVYLALEQLFNPGGKSNSGALRFNATVFLHLYELDLDLLPFLGVRYLITDLQLHDPLATLRTQQSSDDAPPIFLYELANANLGNWSPTRTVLARSFSEAMALLRSREFDLSTTAVVFDLVDGPLVPAQNVSFRFVRGGFQVTADAAGRAAIVLPVQYSTCWRTSADAAPGVALHRVNGFQTLLTFDRHVDARFEFAFGSFGGVGCRSRDVAELKSLGVN
jgi:hypothetical protein